MNPVSFPAIPPRLCGYLIVLACLSACGTVPGRAAGPEELDALGAGLVDVEGMNVRGAWVTAANWKREWPEAIGRLQRSIEGEAAGGDLHWGLAIAPLFSAGQFVPLPLPFWFRSGEGGYIQAFPIANVSEHYFLIGSGLVDIYVARLVVDDREGGGPIGTNEYRGWMFGGLVHSTTDCRLYEEDGVVLGILKRHSWGIGPITIRRKAEFLPLGEAPADGEEEPDDDLSSEDDERYR